MKKNILTLLAALGMILGYTSAYADTHHDEEEHHQDLTSQSQDVQHEDEDLHHES